MALASSQSLLNRSAATNRKAMELLQHLQYCQAMESSFVHLADKLAGSEVKVGKFRADGDQKAYAQQELQLHSFPTILFFPKHASKPIRYPTEKRDVNTLLSLVKLLK